MSPTVCLNMIVKDEAHVIERCLSSVREFVDYWVVVDTGSSDGTPDVVRQALADIPGELHHSEWKDFGTNRTEALELARGKSDFVFVIDADEEMFVPPGFRWPDLNQDTYHILHAHSAPCSFTFWRMSMFRNSRNWRYAGVLHEYPECDGAFLHDRISGPQIVGHFDGGRSQITDLDKYAADAATLERALEIEPDNARYAFYLAQSLRDSGQLEKATEWYERRAAMGGWDEEVWHSMLQLALLAESRNLGEGEVTNLYLRAHDYRPTRAEALGNLARYMRERDRFASCQVFASAALEIPRPDDLLFLDESYYSWRCLDELAIADYWMGNYQDSAEICQELLGSSVVPDDQKARIADNLDFALNKLDPHERLQVAVRTKRHRNTNAGGIHAPNGGV